MGEQPHPWPLLQDQDGKSRHRNLIRNFFRDQTMSSPPALSFDLGGRRMMTGTFRGRTICVPPRRNAAGRAAALAISLAAKFARLSRYGVIRFDRPSTRGQKPRPTLTGLRYRWTARLGRARASAILSDSECCREMSFISEPTPVIVLPWIEEVPFGANFVHGCLLPIYRCQLSSEARFLTVDFPRRCPLSVILSVPFREEEFAVISRYFKSRYHDSAPSAEAPRYQTAGSIGALARDEPVTPGVTFLSHPAPNSED
jgi:hypothetical protein